MTTIDRKSRCNTQCGQTLHCNTLQCYAFSTIDKSQYKSTCLLQLWLTYQAISFCRSISRLESTQDNQSTMIRQQSQEIWGLKITKSALRWIGHALGWLNVLRLTGFISYLATHLVGPFFAWITGVTHIAVT